MRSLGYPRIVSVENFRNPNFELVTDCLMWLLERYDESSADAIDDDISTESDRVFFLKAVAQVRVLHLTARAFGDDAARRKSATLRTSWEALPRVGSGGRLVKALAPPS